MINREKIKELLGTPPALGVEVGYTREFFKTIRKNNEHYLRAQIAVHCDPDAYEQTARKNAELMDELRVLYEKIERGELVERQMGENLNENWPSLFECSICKWSDDDTNTGDTNWYNFCPNCGAKIRSKCDV